MILVTGGCGYIGSHIVDRLQKSGLAAVVLDNLSTGFEDSISKTTPLEVCDLNRIEDIRLVFRKYQIDAVIHLAASTVVPESVENPLKFYSNNTCNTLHLLKVMQEFEVKRLVFSSTAAVYGDVNGTVKESSPLAPVSPYGRSKVMVERMIEDCSSAFGLKYSILRYFNVAGASLDGTRGQRTQRATHLIKVACEVACGKRDEFQLYGTDYQTPDGTCIRDYIHVDDLADIHLLTLKLLESETENSVYNCGYGRGISVREVLEALEKVSGQRIAVRNVDRRKGDVGEITADPSKLIRETGWKPKYADIHTIVKSAYEFERSL